VRDHRAGRRTALLEIALLLGVVHSYMWLWGGSFPGSFIVVGVAVLTLAIGSAWARGEGLRELGIRLDTFPAALRDAAAVTIPVAAGILVGGAWLGTVRADWPIVVARLPWLVGWGFLQQIVLQGFVHRRVGEILERDDLRQALTAAIFAFCHLPNPPLVAATFVGGWIWARIFRRAPNLLALALSHGVGSGALSIAFGPALLHGMRVGRGYFTYLPPA